MRAFSNLYAVAKYKTGMETAMQMATLTEIDFKSVESRLSWLASDIAATANGFLAWLLPGSDCKVANLP